MPFKLLPFFDFILKNVQRKICTFKTFLNASFYGRGHCAVSLSQQPLLYSLLHRKNGRGTDIAGKVFYAEMKPYVPSFMQRGRGTEC